MILGFCVFMKKIQDKDMSQLVLMTSFRLREFACVGRLKSATHFNIQFCPTRASLLMCIESYCACGKLHESSPRAK